MWWNTDEGATSQVAYSTVSHAGDTDSSIAEVLAVYGKKTAEDGSLVMVHAVSASGLVPGTTYYFRVLSKDVYGNEAWSGEYSFTTDPDETPPVISGVVVPDATITETKAVVWWNTDEGATSQVAYSTVSHAGSFIVPSNWNRNIPICSPYAPA